MENQPLGKPRLVGLEAFSGFREEGALKPAAGLEQASEHPLAAAVVNHAKEKGIAIPEVKGFESLTGKGVRGTVDGKPVALGNKSLLEDLWISADEWPQKENSGWIRLSRKCFRTENRKRSSACNPRAGPSQWRATASRTRRPWRKRM